MTEKILPEDIHQVIKKVASEYSEIPSTFLYARLNGDFFRSMGIDKGATIPIRMPGLSVMLLKKGSINLEIDLQSYMVGPDSLVVMPTGSMVKPSPELLDSLDLYFIFLAPKFLQDINVNLTSIFVPELLDQRSPVLNINDQESNIIYRYFELLNLTAAGNNNPVIERKIASAIISALVYQMVQFHFNRMYITSSPTGNKSTKLNHVREFLKLIHSHYISERHVSFYARKLCISTKYLSMIVKETTGRAPGQWIDHLIGIQAKSLLRYSGKNIQQVAYALNFPSQAAFGKFFKNHTGMTPSQFQKS